MRTLRCASGLLLCFIVATIGCEGAGAEQRVPAQLPDKPLTARTEPATAIDTNRFHPVSLDRFHTRPLSYFKATEPNGAWSFVPQGTTDFGGVPFRMFGFIELTGLGPARDRKFQLTRVGEIPVAARAARLHLIHGAAYADPDGTPVSSVVLHYRNGQDRKVFLRYGVHVRNWFVERTEKISQLQDPRSAVVWNGNTRSDGRGTPTRLFKTTFDNPIPAEEIRGIELQSLFARANSVILAITLESAPGAGPANVPDEEDDTDLRREMLVRTLDEKTGLAVSNIVVTVGVHEGERRYGFGKYWSDLHGQILIDYPPGKFDALRLRINDLVNPPFDLMLTNEGGVFPSEFPVRLKHVAVRPQL